MVVADGFDVAIMGFVAPYIKADWQLSNNALAPVLSAALAGLAVGAMITGPLADKFGRRKVLLGNVLCFGLATLFVAHANSIWQMVLFRFIAGCAMGGIMPNAATLVTEFSPSRKRAFLITVVFAGFTVGAAGGGFLAAWLIPHYGWHSVFFPLKARATGNGWMHGIGRIGAFVSAFVGAWFLNWGWDFKTVAIVLTIPALLVGIALWTKGAVYRQRS